MKHTARRYIGPSVTWTSAATSIAVLLFNRFSPTPLTEAELAVVIVALPVLLRAIEGHFHKQSSG